MKIVIETIPHNKQRYETAGDWFRDKNGVLQIKVSETGDEDCNSLIAVHELVEAILCEHRGIPEECVTGFDMAFRGNSEPGDAQDSPYRDEHQYAEAIERLLAFELGVDWRRYGEIVKIL